MNRCPDPREWVLYAADESPPRRRSALEIHLESCAACRRELAAVEQGLAAMKTLDPLAVKPEVLASLRRRLAVAAAHKVARPTILVLVHRFRWAAAAAVLVAAALLWTFFPSSQPTANGWLNDEQVTEELAEITAGIEMLETGNALDPSAEDLTMKTGFSG